MSSVKGCQFPSIRCFEMWHLNVALLLCIGLGATLVISYITSQRKNVQIRSFMASMSEPIAARFIGNAYVLTKNARKSAFHTLMELANRCIRSRFGALWLLGDPYLLTSDPSTFKALLSCSQNINKPKEYAYFKEHCHGICTANGPEWRKMRKIINPTTRTSVLEPSADNFKYHTETFLEDLRQYTVTGDGFDVYLLMHMCTIDLTCDNLFECRLDAQKKKLAHFATNLKKSTKMIVERSFCVPLWSDVVYSLLGKRKEMDDAVKPMHDIAREMLEQQVRRRLESKNERSQSDKLKTFMEVMVDSVMSGDITKDQAVAETVEMFIAGSATTATTNSWVFKMLAMRPDIQQRVYNEIMETCKGQEVTLGDISKLSYLEMVVKEILRHFTIPFILRHITDDLKVNDEVTIPAGITVMLIPFLLHHDSEYWEKPGEFYPEHFSVENESKREKNVFFPFAGGPRICPGSKYAMLSTKYLIANTLLRYEFHTDEKPLEDVTKDDLHFVFMLHPASGFHVKIRERKPVVS